MFIILLSAIFILIIIPAIAKVFPKYLGSILALAPAAYFIYFLTLLPSATTAHLFFRFAWAPSANADLLFRVDGLSIFFALLICFVGVLIFVYANSYLQGDSNKGKFFIYLYLFMMSMLLLVLSDNLIVMFVCWELTSISSFFLIGFYHEQEEGRKSALQAMLTTGLGGLALLAAFIMMGISGGGFNVSEINWQSVQTSPVLEAMLILVFLGAFTKSAQFPFHYWLPNAMAAPTPVSAYLHSATMVKAGIFLLFRFNPYLGSSALWQYSLIIFGTLTMVIGAWQSTIKNDIKKVLAYITVSALGMMTLMIGLGTEKALKAALVFLLAHALYKAALFLIAGILAHEEGTKNMAHLYGLFRKMPATAVVAILACLSMGGIPPLFGFIGKESLYEAGVHAPGGAFIIMGALIITSILFIIVALRIGYGIFFYKLKDLYLHEASLSLLIPAALLALLGLGFGVVPHTLNPLLGSALNSVYGHSEIHLQLFHGFNLVFWLSILTIGVAALLFISRFQLYLFLRAIPQAINDLPENFYFKMLKTLDTASRQITVFLQNGNLRTYLFTILATLSLLLILSILYFSTFDLPEISGMVLKREGFEIFVIFMIALALVGIFQTDSRLTILITLSISGFGIASLFLFYSAPDVSMTQFLVETLTLILVILILHKFPEIKIHQLYRFKKRNLTIAILFGAIVTFILLFVNSFSSESELKEFYIANSEALGKGRNVVNVILVDFRAMDTLGEITVLGIAAIGIVALLNIKSRI